jgi:hypothetical protein
MGGDDAIATVRLFNEPDAEAFPLDILMSARIE